MQPALRRLGSILVLACVGAAQTPVDVRDRLERGDLPGAIRAVAATDAATTERLEMATAVLDAVDDHGAGLAASWRNRAALAVLEALASGTSAKHRATRAGLVARAGAHLVAAWGDTPPAVEAAEFAPYLRGLEATHEALVALGRREGRAMIELNMAQVPALRAAGRHSRAARLCYETLALEPSDAERQTLRIQYGLALLDSHRVREALPFLDDYLAQAPADPTHVLPIADAVPLDESDALCRMLLPVARRAATPGQAAPWHDCLARLYAALGSGSKAPGAVNDYFATNRWRQPLPRVWRHLQWEPGYRVWRPDGIPSGKQYSGDHALEGVLPASHGWHASDEPPTDLKRWANTAFAFHRAPDGPTMVVYWFAPDHHYWFGTTARDQGVTGKMVRGSTRGGIARLVGDVAYGIDALEHGKRFRPCKPLPLRSGVSGGIRKAWRHGDWIYDETFFSLGQVTCEVLLRVRDQDWERDAAELRWMMRNVRTH
ncbi:MAG: hypothetical protein AAF628_22465 [Planctomycetota bacterium]